MSRAPCFECSALSKGSLFPQAEAPSSGNIDRSCAAAAGRLNRVFRLRLPHSVLETRGRGTIWSTVSWALPWNGLCFSLSPGNPSPVGAPETACSSATCWVCHAVRATSKGFGEAFALGRPAQEQQRTRGLAMFNLQEDCTAKVGVPPTRGCLAKPFQEWEVQVGNP